MIGTYFKYILLLILVYFYLSKTLNAGHLLILGHIRVYYKKYEYFSHLYLTKDQHVHPSVCLW